MPPLTALLLAGFGAFAGLTGTLLGVGGGVFLIPALVLWGGVDLAHAVAAGLVAVIATSSAAGSVNVERGTANMRLGMVLETTTVLGALTGGFSAALIPARWLIGLFAVLLAAVTVLLWRGRGTGTDGQDAGPADGVLGASYHDAAAGREVAYSVVRLPAGLAASFIAGNLSGLLGIGGGVIKVPVLHLYCGMPMKAAAATSNFMIGVTAAAGAVVYLARGAFEPALTAAVVLGVLAGSAAGSAVNRRVGDAHIRRVFALLTAFLAVQMTLKARHG